MMRNLYKIDWTKFDPHTTVFLLIKYKKSICFQLFIEFEEVGLFILVFDWKCCWSLIFFLQKWLGFLWQGISWYNWIILSIMWHFTHDFILFLSMIFDIRFPLCCLFQWHLTFSLHYIVYFNDIWHYWMNANDTKETRKHLFLQYTLISFLYNSRSNGFLFVILYRFTICYHILVSSDFRTQFGT